MTSTFACKVLVSVMKELYLAHTANIAIMDEESV